MDKSTPAIKNKCTRSEYDITTVYSHGKKPDGPFIAHEKLDLATLLHMRGFWQRHLLNQAEQTYHESFAKLPIESRPQLRKSSTDQETGLSVSWLGYYCTLSHFQNSLDTNLTFLINQHASIPCQPHARTLKTKRPVRTSEEIISAKSKSWYDSISTLLAMQQDTNSAY